MKTEPAVVVGAIVAIIVALINTMQAFGVPVTPAQEDELVKLISAVLEFLIVMGGFIVVRQFVYSRASVAKLTGVDEPIVPAAPLAAGRGAVPETTSG
ncbi:MAG: hypothetical protein ACRDJC_15100 [Thermomicrobiales bacterium]